jgi:hypothetical protein
VQPPDHPAADPGVTAGPRPSSRSGGPPAAHRRHRKQSRTSGALKHTPTKIVALAGVAVIGGAAAISLVPKLTAQTTPSGPSHEDVGHGPDTHAQENAPSSALADGTAMDARSLLAEDVSRAAATAQARPKPTARPAPRPSKTQPPPQPEVTYLNPLRAVSGLILERIDMGVDFGGAGPVYALGDAVITNATGDSPGWPGGGWITYQMTDGPAAGLQVYLAEDVTPTVQVGEKVTASTVIANMFNGGAGIETGWAMPDGASAESQLPEAGSVGGGGPFPTRVGVSFDNLLEAVGVAPAPNAGDAPFGTLPSNIPNEWPGVGKP